jgi:hypothetical protein
VGQQQHHEANTDRAPKQDLCLNSFPLAKSLVSFYSGRV